MNQHHPNHDRLQQVAWLLEKRLSSNEQEVDSYEPYYGDVTELNTNRLILDSVGKDTLRQIAEDAIDLLGSSVSIYENNGDYAFGLFSSGWCQFMDAASRRRCQTDDNRTALDCGRWLCHETCWNDSAKKALESGHHTDAECVGGIHLYAEPIYAGENIIGVINIGYGTPPKEHDRLQELADLFEVDVEKLKEQADSYAPRPQFLVDLAKKRLKTSAKIIGEIVEKSMLQKALQKNKELLGTAGRMAKVGGWELDANTKEVIWTEETYHIHEVPLSHKPSFNEAIDFFHPEDRPKLEQALQHALDHGEPYDLEIRFITAKGNHKWTRSICRPEILHGKTIRLLGTFQDITGRKNNEEELHATKETFRQLFENISNGVAVFTVADEGNDFVFKNINKASEKIDRVSRDEVIGKNIKEVFPVVTDFGLFDILQRVWQTGKPENHQESYYKDNRIEGWRKSYVYKLPSGEIVSCYNDITKEKKAEEKLRKSESFLQSLLDAIPIPVFYRDTSGRYVGFNNSFKQFFGKKEDKLMGAHVFDVYPPDLANLCAVTDMQLLENGKIQEYESEAQDASGDRRNVIFKKAVFHDSDGKAAGIIGTIQDITKRKKTEDALQDAQRWLTSVIDFLPDPTFVIDNQGVVQMWNQALSSLTGIRPEEMIGKGSYAYAVPFYGKERPLLIDMVLNWDERFEDTYTSLEKQSDEVAVSLSFHPNLNGGTYLSAKARVLYDTHGQPAGAIESLRDITEMKEIESRLQSLVDNLFDALVVTDEEGIIQFVNPAAQKLLGRENSQTLGMEFGFPVDLDEAIEVDIFQPHKGVRQAEARATKTEWKGRQAHLISLRDITEKRLAEQERDAINLQLQQSQKIESIGNLAGGIAHDFNNMLSIILGYGQELMGNLHTNDPLYESAQEIVEAGKRSAALTRQLLAFSRKQTLQPEVLDLNMILTDIEKVLRRVISEDIELTMLLAEDLRPVEVDPGQIEQVVMNLAVNAKDAMPLGGKLTIETTNVTIDKDYQKVHVGVASLGGYAMLSVTDNGCGMNKETRERVFEPFFTTKETHRGTGLGLSTVYGIVKQSRGNIWVYSEPGQGTTFKIYLPHTTKSISGEHTQKEQDSIIGEKELILIVEDEPSLRKLCMRVLQSLNYQTNTASNGGDALLLIEEKNLRPDLILTDVVMPEMSGRVLIERLKKTIPEIKFLFMSGYTDNAIVHHGVLDAGVPFIQKPFTKESLGKAVASLLNTV